MVEHRHVRLDGGQGLGRSAGCARDGGGEPAGLGLVVDEVDRIRRHPARGGATVAGAGGGHGDAGRGVGGGNLQPARVVIAFGAPVVGGRLPDLGGGGIGQRHPRVRELLPAARARWRSRGGAVVLVHGGRDAGCDQCGDDEDDRPGAPQQAHPGPGPPAGGGVAVVGAPPGRAGGSGSEQRKASTTAGCSRTAPGGPPAITAPRSMATRRSASSAMKAMSCSTTSRVASSRSRTLCNRPTIASTSRWATPEAGSSRRTTEGWWATTAARSTRRREPVDSSLTRLSAYRSRPKGASSSSTRL